MTVKEAMENIISKKFKETKRRIPSKYQSFLEQERQQSQGAQHEESKDGREETSVSDKNKSYNKYKIKNNKKIVDIQVSIYSEKNNDDLALVIISDITKMKKYEKQKQIDKLKTVYFASIAHDLRTPINSIMGTNQVLANRLDQDSRAQQMLSVSNSSCKFLLAIIDDIMDLSRLELNQFKLQKELFNVETCIQNVIEVLNIQAQMKNISITYSIERSLRNLIYTDQKRLSQILFNLIGNALKFTMKGEIKITAEIVRDASYQRSKTEMVEFKVIDSGIGIKECDQGKLFKLFGRLKSKKGLNESGVGLGLTISKRLTE